nr:ATP-binding protein [Algoriphagus ratkowskyi]
MGIPFFLKQLFSNLISNSIKYAKDGVPPTIEITSRANSIPYSTGNNGKFWVVSVSDNGIGFDQKYAETIFNVFTRLHLATEYSGSGVGLALCKKIMKNHKGYITAVSNPGEGTVINLYFPEVSSKTF